MELLRRPDAHQLLACDHFLHFAVRLHVVDEFVGVGKRRGPAPHDSHSDLGIDEAARQHAYPGICRDASVSTGRARHGIDLALAKHLVGRYPAAPLTVADFALARSHFSRAAGSRVTVLPERSRSASPSAVDPAEP